MSEILSLDDFDDALDLACEQIEAGLPVGLPTDTVYVLACDPIDPGATDRLFALKQRPRTQDLSIVVASVDQALGLTTAVPPGAKVLMDAFWPGPLTLVLPADPERQLQLGEDELTVGIRMPDHEVPLELCDEVGPLAATPAGVQGEVVHETAAEVAEAFGQWVPYVLDGGRCAGRAATVVDATGEEPRLIREGPVDWDDIRAALD